MTTVYLETTIPSYLAARASRDLINEDVRALTRHYGRSLGLSGKALADIPHIAYAVASYRHT